MEKSTTEREKGAQDLMTLFEYLEPAIPEAWSLFHQMKGFWHISYCFFYPVNFLFSWSKSLKNNFQKDCIGVIPSEYYDQKCSNSGNSVLSCVSLGKQQVKLTPFCMMVVQCSCNIGKAAFLGKKIDFIVKFQFKFQLFHLLCDQTNFLTSLNLSSSRKQRCYPPRETVVFRLCK